MLRYDLHCHSTCSDGLLAPAAVVRLAARNGVDVLALTDHDDTGGIAEALEAARESAIAVVAGVELSTTWEGQTIHIVGVRIDPANKALDDGLAQVRVGRDSRARRIGDALAAAGIPGAYDGARRFVTSDRLISRSHFARFLVEQGHAKQTRDVFKRYLTHGNPGYVAHAWATVPQAIEWIHAAGGQAIVAHPGRYRVTASARRRLLSEFRDAGGDGIEVLSASHSADEAAEFATLARVFGLLASTGSDYHGPGESPVELGAMPMLPPGVTPVWSRW
ncbi:MAG: 3',5'-nucleoside bisphosphate phosphatase [Burkholderiales bacterium]